MQIQQNLMGYMRLFEKLSSVATGDDQDSFWIASNQPAPGNMVLRTEWSPLNAESKIDALLQRIGTHAKSIDWFVFPTDQPADLSQRLENRGMPGGPGGHWLWIDLMDPYPVQINPRGLTIRRVENNMMLTDWIKLSESGFGTDLTLFYEAYSAHGYGPDAVSTQYIGYLDGVGVTSATLLDDGNSATIYDLSTPPTHRGQGFGGSLMNYLISEIRLRGYKNSWIWASPMARSLYTKLGYQEIDFGIREHIWTKT